MHIFSQTRLPFDNAVIEEGSGVVVRANNFTHLVVGKSMKKGAPAAAAGGFRQGRQTRETGLRLQQRHQPHGR